MTIRSQLIQTPSPLLPSQLNFPVWEFSKWAIIENAKNETGNEVSWAHYATDGVVIFTSGPPTRIVQRRTRECYQRTESISRQLRTGMALAGVFLQLTELIQGLNVKWVTYSLEAEVLNTISEGNTSWLLAPPVKHTVRLSDNNSFAISQTISS